MEQLWKNNVLNSNKYLLEIYRSIYIFLNRRWLFDKVYIDWIGRPSLTFGYQVSFKSIDKGVLEILGPFGITESIRRLLVHVREIQSGLIYHYAFMILLGLTFLLTFLSLDLLIGLWVDIHLWCLCAIGFLGFLQGQDFKKSLWTTLSVRPSVLEHCSCAYIC